MIYKLIFITMMKKYRVLLLVVGILVVSSATAFAAEAATTRTKTKKANPTCVATAIDKREAALVKGYETSRNSIIAAFKVRATALKDSWKQPEAKNRQGGVKRAWETFRESRKAARGAWAEAHKAAWAEFYTEVRACGVTSNADLGGSPVEDAGL